MLSKNKKRIILIDSHALLHRAYHAMSGFSTRDGRPTGALFGFVRMIFNGVKDIDPEYVIACYDLPKPTFRHIAYDNYKGTRQKTDEDLKVQIKESKRFCQALGVPIIECEGFEADDLLGTLSRQFDHKEYDVVIVSGDMDVMQLINKNVFVYTMKKGNETAFFDEAGVLAKYGIKPTQIPDYKGLAGDAGDNIMGVDGIGDKTAIKLINAFDTIENLYKNIKKNEDEVLKHVSARILQKLKDGEDEAAFSKTLATIRLDAPVKPDTTHPWPKCVDISEYQKLCDEYELRSLRNYFDYLDMENGSHQEVASPAIKISEEDMDELHSMAILLNSEQLRPTFEEIKTSYGLAGNLDMVKKGLLEKLKEEKLIKYFEEIEKPILKIVKHMQGSGMLINQKALDDELNIFSKKIKEKENKIYKLAGREFLISSPKQLGEVLYDELKLGEKIKKTATGKRSTNVEMLISMKDEHEIINEILSWRELTKLYSTYLVPLKGFIGEDGRIHPHFIPAGAATGRFSCENPNMQNLPVKSEYSESIRNIFVAEWGYKLLSLDYSQVDLRSAAILSGDENLLDIFKRNQDVHLGVAARTLHKKEEDVTKEERRKAKAINFGILYGMGVNALRESMGVDRAEAQEFYDTYKATFVTLMNYLEKVKQEATKSGYTTTLFGRPRHIPLLRSHIPFMRAQGERIAINAPIQGTSADIIKLGMIDVWNDMQEYFKNGSVKMQLQIHDELVFEVRDDVVDEVSGKIKTIMENVLEKRGFRIIPLVVSLDTGDTLGNI
jgi:DNA polymerase-1